MKKQFYILSALFVIVVIAEIIYAFGLLESHTTRVVEKNLGEWTILVNEVDVTGEVVEFDIDNINYDTDSNVKSGKIAPGLGGYFDISIDPTDTDVSIRYDITYDKTSIQATQTSIDVTSVAETSGKTIVRTGENTYTGIISLNEINNNQVDTIRTTINWPNVEANGEKDYEVGKTSNASIELPIAIKLTQYTGEQITAYVGE